MNDIFLVANRTSRFAAFTFFYVSQGLPIGLLTIAVPAWLAGSGSSAGEIASFIAITTLPWGFKLFAGPLMDRYAYLPMGRRRPWVIGAQFGLVLSLLLMSLVPDPTANIGLLTLAGFLVNVFASVQDVAVDGMAIDVLPVAERGRANAFMAGGQVFGYSVSAIVSARLIANYGLASAVVVLALGVSLVLILGLALRERAGERILPWTEGVASAHGIDLQIDNWGFILKNILRVLFLPGSLILLTMTLLYRGADGIYITAVPVIVVQELGWADTDYSDWMALASGIAAFFGLLAGPLIDNTGSQKLLTICLPLVGGIYLLTGFGVDYWHLGLVLLLSLFATQLTLQIVFICVIALHMGVCWQKIAATQFAIYMAWANLTRSMGAASYQPITEYLALGEEFLLMGGLCITAGIVVRFLNTNEHNLRLASLDK